MGPLVFAGFGVGSGGVPAGLSKAVCGICRVFAGLQLGSAWAPCILQDFVCGGASNQASGSKS